MKYVAIETLLAYLDIGNSHNPVAAESALAAAEKQVEELTGRSFVDAGNKDPRYFRADHAKLLMIDDAVGIEEVAISRNGRSGTYTAIDNEYVITETVNVDTTTIDMIELDGKSFPVGERCWVRVTPLTNWGWADVPDAIIEYVLLQASRLFIRHDSPGGLVSGFEGTGLHSIEGGDKDAMQQIMAYRRVDGIIA